MTVKNNPRFPRAESDFVEDEKFASIFATHDLPNGRMIASSKSTYCREHEGDLVIFNANIITLTYKKIWYGDLNISEDFDHLKNIADELGEDLYILMEGDARFGYENDDIKILISKSRTIIKSNKTIKGTKKIKLKKTKKDGTNNRSTK